MYAQRADMIARFGESEVVLLTDRARNGQIDDAVLAAALQTATDEVDVYLSGRYPLPLPTAPRILIGVACDIARYRLVGNEVNETDPIRQRYHDAVRLLENLATGKVKLGLPASSTPPVIGGVKVSGGTRTFSSQTLADYQQ